MLNPILKNKLEKVIFPILPKKEIKTKEELQEKYSYAFNLLAISTILDLDINMTEEYITDGTDDKGIDGVYIDNSQDPTTILFFQSKYFEFQSIERNKQIGETEINKIKEIIEDIIYGKTIEKVNDRLNEKIKEIRLLQKDSMQPLNIKIYIISNAEFTKTIHDNAKYILENDLKNNYITFEDVNINDLFNLIDDNKKNKNITTTITASGQINDSIIGGVVGRVFNLKATELIKLYMECGKDNIFSNNIRFFLKSSKINKEIQNTIKDLEFAKYFWFFNNGISIIADKVEAPDIFHDGNGNRKLTLSNPSIINGGQTTRSLYNLFTEQPDLFDTNNKNIESVQVLVRVYEISNNEKLIEKITKGTNRQNAILATDLLSNNKILLKIKELFKDNGICFETKRGEFNNQICFVIKSEAVFQMYISLYEQKPHIAKNKLSAIERFSNLILIDKNKDIAQKFFRSYEIWNFVHEKEKNIDKNFLEQNIFIINATFSIMYTMTLLDKELLDINKKIDYTKAETTYLDTIKILRIIVNKQIEELKDGYNNNLFFKNSNSTILIENHINQ